MKGYAQAKERKLSDAVLNGDRDRGLFWPFLKNCMTAVLPHTQESFGFKNPANLLAVENPEFRHTLPRRGEKRRLLQTGPPLAPAANRQKSRKGRIDELIAG
jgi:hypothetical protein